MNKYVELGAVQKKIMEMIRDTRGTYLAKNIEEIPLADVQEVKRGHWIGQPISGYADCRCSVCGAVCHVHACAGIPTQRYCYRCGAKMDGKEQEMDREKQIEEMATVINEMDERNAHYYDKYMRECEAFADANAIAKVLYDAGYRKQSEVAMEIIGEILLSHTLDIDGFFTMHESELIELKKKYVEESKNDR